MLNAMDLVLLRFSSNAVQKERVLLLRRRLVSFREADEVKGSEV